MIGTYPKRTNSPGCPLIMFADACDKYNLAPKALAGMLSADDAPKAINHAGGTTTVRRTYFDGKELHSFLKQKGKV
jgi:hypothetical protein